MTQKDYQFKLLQSRLNNLFGKTFEPDDYLFLVLPEERIIGIRVGAIDTHHGIYSAGCNYVEPSFQDGKLTLKNILPSNKRFCLYKTAKKWFGAPNKAEDHGKYLLNQRNKPKGLVTEEEVIKILSGDK